MPAKYILKGYPNECIGESINGIYNKSVTDIATSVSKEFVGDLTEVFITPALGNKIIIKGVTLHGEGNAGAVKLTSGTRVILPLYFSNSSRAGASSALNVELDTDATVLIVATNRGTSTTFVGVSYIEVVGA